LNVSGSTELVRATEAQKTARDRVTYAAWGERLELPQYLERERLLRAHPWAAHEMTTWLLVKAGVVMASCETFRMGSRLAAGRRVEEGSTYAVASVYVEPHFRGRGLATELMDLLIQQLDGQPPDDAQAVILFSDVGTELYERSGFEALRSREWVLPADPAAQHSEKVELIHQPNLPEALARFRRPNDTFLVWPSADQVDWHLERERCYAQLLNRVRPEACGARWGERAILWMADFKEEVLRVLLADLGDGAGALVNASLFGAAQLMAAKAGLKSVILWDEPWVFQGDVPVPGKQRERSSSIPMIRSLSDLPPGAWSRAPRALWV
jgi:GNAT superfamily N-acetyltransferase